MLVLDAGIDQVTHGYEVSLVAQQSVGSDTPLNVLLVQLDAAVAADDRVVAETLISAIYDSCDGAMRSGVAGHAAGAHVMMLRR
ncbi:hypothetical protein [Rhizosaccharibacter radicis]|uniref:Uncharacterized protein n=1 Tax=Rhizosaccharibacter radicis TaxID=2782605 RepID=A0ABT1W3C5_9PROT|nr:hypothetical protein [Acetobacteraceae bacterium KSS12]